VKNRHDGAVLVMYSTLELTVVHRYSLFNSNLGLQKTTELSSPLGMTA